MHLASNFLYVLTILYLLFAKLEAKLIGFKTSNQSLRILRILRLSACKLTQLAPPLIGGKNKFEIEFN